MAEINCIPFNIQDIRVGHAVYCVCELTLSYPTFFWIFLSSMCVFWLSDDLILYVKGKIWSFFTFIAASGCLFACLFVFSMNIFTCESTKRNIIWSDLFLTRWLCMRQNICSNLDIGKYFKRETRQFIFLIESRTFI